MMEMDTLRPEVPAWYPHRGYQCGMARWGAIPPGAHDCAVDGGKSVHVPTAGHYDAGKWGAPPSCRRGGQWAHTPEGDRDVVGQYLCMLVLRENIPLGPPSLEMDPLQCTTMVEGKRIYSGKELPFMIVDHLEEWEHRNYFFVPRSMWMFACVSGFNTYKNTHTLTFVENGCFYPGYEVDLARCLFQIWSKEEVASFIPECAALPKSVESYGGGQLRRYQQILDMVRDRTEALGRDCPEDMRERLRHVEERVCQLQQLC